MTSKSEEAPHYIYDVVEKIYTLRECLDTLESH